MGESRAPTVAWEDFAAEVAEIAQVPADEVVPETRLLEDLALDSLALTELVVVLVDKYDTWSLSEDLETRSWQCVTVRQLYDEYLTGAPVAPASPAGVDASNA